jgi:hypothetical protein
MDEPTSLILERRMFSTIKRSATIIISTQVNTYLSAYFSVVELLLLIFVLHVIFQSMRTVGGFGASWGALRDLTQLIFIQMLLSYLSNEWHPDLAFLNLIALLLIAECVPAARGWIGTDIVTFKTSVTYLFSDRVGSLLDSLHVPVACSVLGLILSNENGILSQSLALTGVNTLCNAAFGAVVSGGSLALAWPVALLYFVHELASKFEKAKDFLDFGLYKASGLVYTGLLARDISSLDIMFGIGFLLVLLPRDPIWGGICALVLVQAGSDWFLHAISLLAHSDPVLAGLGIVTTLHFVGLGIAVSSDPDSSTSKKTPSKSNVGK